MMKQLLITFFVLLGLSASWSQCYPDRHSTNWFDGWVSCETSPNPNSLYGNSHWIMYDLGFDYELKETRLWNANEPNNLDYGINEFNIDYSLDGVEWFNLGTFNLEQASGESIYEGVEGPNFNETLARYVLITPTTNHGGECFGFSEFKVNINDPLTVIDEEDGFNALVYPNPFVNNVTLRIASLYEDLPIEYALYDILGRQIIRKTLPYSADSDTYPITLNGGNLTTGIYILKIEQGDKKRSFKLIKN